jgi:hypothetical protein
MRILDISSPDAFLDLKTITLGYVQRGASIFPMGLGMVQLGTLPQGRRNSSVMIFQIEKSMMRDSL